MPSTPTWSRSTVAGTQPSRRGDLGPAAPADRTPYGGGSVGQARAGAAQTSGSVARRSHRRVDGKRRPSQQLGRVGRRSPPSAHVLPHGDASTAVSYAARAAACSHAARPMLAPATPTRSLSRLPTTISGDIAISSRY